MKIILLEDVKSLGKKGDIVDVNEGYARNCILKKNLGVEANASNMNDLKLKKNNDAKIAQEQLEAAQAFAKDLESKEVTIFIKAGEGGKLFGSVTGKEIAQAFKDQCKVDIDKKKIQLPEPIRSFGVFDVKVKLHPQVTGSLKVKVKEQN
ncbi:MAG: 50S ribosomal protein L9 [Lachnospiraceae bacterium]|nr:50S ribosomal protein L9 [Lachnospiraceae bacterium]MBP5745499.1 50S ribosomal protein L9 [Lachnospiraceae bacterium]